VSTTRELLNAIKLRAWSLVIASNGDIDYRTAERAAAQEIQAQERAKKRNAALQSCAAAPSLEGVTVSNARKFLYDRLAEIASRLALSAHLVDEPPQIRKHTQDPEGYLQDCGRSPPRGGDPPTSYAKPEPEPPADQASPVLIFGTTTATSELIPDTSFHRSVQSPTTQNWRKSIEDAEKRARSRWVG
jgi:hypothetical protein